MKDKDQTITTNQDTPTMTNLLEEFKSLLGITDDKKAHKVITRLYIEDRMQPVVIKYNINNTKLTTMCDLIHKAYMSEDYSLDKIIDAIYNYYNQNHKSPTKAYLEDITALLEDYYEEELL